ncbi:MAG: hypothetical protein AAF678_05930 [Pseudomonadota bacterium]
MSVQNILDTCRHSTDGCDIVAFGDYRSLLILRSSHQAHLRREALDALTAEAATLFEQLDAIANADRATTPLLTGASFNGKKALAFARSEISASEFICLTGSFSISVQEVLRLAARTLQDVEAAA